MSPTLRSPDRHATIIALLFGATALGACAPDIEQKPEPPARVSAIFDPVTSTIPLPNNAAIDPADGTLRDLPTIGRMDAEGEFAAWLTQLHGWLPETGIEIPFSGELDEASLNDDTIKLYEIGAMGALTELAKTVTYAKRDNGTSVVTIVPASALRPGQDYAALATTEIKDTKGDTILAPSALFVALNGSDIIDPESQAITLPQLKDSPETAASLQGLHRTLKPIIGAVEAGQVKGAGGQTLSRKQIAVAFTWKTAVDPFTVLDPATATIPLPNTLALDADGTFPAAALPALRAYNQAVQDFRDQKIPAAPSVTAQVWFDQYLDSLHGWPTSKDSLPVELPISGDLDPATVNGDTVQLWRRTAQGAERVEGVTVAFVKAQEGSIHKIRLTLPADLDYGGDYFAFATTGIKGTNGLKLLPPAPMYMALQPHPVIDEQGNSLVSRLATPQAQAIHGVKQVLTPAMEAIKANTALTHKDLASVWSWFSWKDPFIVFDPTTGDIPIPNAFLIDATTGKVNLPTQGAQGLQLALFNELNSRDGFSVLGDAWFSVIGELDPATVTLYTQGSEGSIAMAQRPRVVPELMGADTIELDYVKDYNKVLIRMKRPLAKSTLHVGIVSNRLKGINGLAVKPTPLFVFLASPAPLVKDGKSEVAQLPDANAQQLEAARMTYSALFQGARITTGDTAETIACAFAFTTDDHNEPLQQARARAMAKLGDAPLSAARATNDVYVVNPGDASWKTYNGPFSDGATPDLDNIQAIQWTAEYDSVNLYAPNTAELTYEQMTPTRVGISVFIPREVPGVCEAPFPVAITVHGIGGWRQSAALTLANELAAPQSCVASVAVDLPTHGGRAEGAMSLHPTARPMNSGAGFLSANLLQTRANFAQGAVDLAVLARVIKDGGLDAVLAQPGLLSDKVGLAGISLGGAISQLATTIDPNLNVTALNVPPGKLTFYLTQPSDIGSGIVAALSGLGLMPGTFAFEQTISFVQWMADVVDPQAFAPYTTKNTLKVLEYVPGGVDGDPTKPYRVLKQGPNDVSVPAAQVMVQLAKDDATTPNVGTQGLAAELGVSLEKTTYTAPHGFINTDATPEGRCGRKQVAAWISSGLRSGTAALPPTLEATPCVESER